jgi:hypothetical protein
VQIQALGALETTLVSFLAGFLSVTAAGPPPS